MIDDINNVKKYMIAFAKGEPVEFRYEGSDEEWMPVTISHDWSIYVVEYRIRPANIHFYSFELYKNGYWESYKVVHPKDASHVSVLWQTFDKSRLVEYVINPNTGEMISNTLWKKGVVELDDL